MTANTPSLDDSERVLSYERFFELFKAHQITHTLVPKIVQDFGITASMLRPEEKARLLAQLQEPLLSFLSSEFEVNPEWLRGHTDLPMDSVGKDAYKSEQWLCRDVVKLRNSGADPTIWLVKGSSSSLQEAFEKGLQAAGVKVGIVVSSTKRLRQTDFSYLHHTWWGARDWNYERARVHLKCVILFCNRARIRVNGRELADDLFRALLAKRVLLADAVGDVRYFAEWDPSEYVRERTKAGAKEPSEASTTRAYYSDVLHFRALESELLRNEPTGPS